LAKGEEKPVRFRLSARDVSTVDTQGRRSVQPGSYTLSVGGGQPTAAAHVSGQFSITGSSPLPE
jgi:beta-glucosidase